MDWLTFVEKLVEALIWPALILFIAIRFKSEFSNLLLSITKFKGPGFELERQLREAEQIAANLPAPPERKTETVTVAPSDEQITVVENLVPHSPGAAILAMWNLVENELANAFGTNTRGPHGFGLSFTVPEPLLELYNRLQAIRNEVAHSLHGATVDEAQHFITLSRRFLVAIDEIREPVERIENERFDDSDDLLRAIKDKSAAIQVVEIPRTTHLKFTKKGERSKVIKDVGAILKMINGTTSIISMHDAEQLLNDGVLNTMHIPIRFMRE